MKNIQNIKNLPPQKQLLKYRLQKQASGGKKPLTELCI